MTLPDRGVVQGRWNRRQRLRPYRRVIAPGHELISRSFMDKRSVLRPGLFAPALALTISLAACGGGSSVTLKHIAGGGPDNCFLPVFDGQLVSDPTAVTVFITQYGRWPVLWPAGWTGRSSGSEIEILDPRGTVVARTGTSFYPSGGLNADGNWEMCSLVFLPPAG